jgi:AcrR family transcriptional regulator
MPTQAERRATTKEQLLKAAGGEFARHGYERTTLDQVAARAGASKGAVYHHFASKEELFMTLLKNRLDERLGEVQRAFETAQPAKLQSREAALEFVRAGDRDPRWTPLFFEFLAHCARDPRKRKHFAERFLHRSRDFLAGVVERRYAELGVEPPLPSTELATCIQALVNGMQIERLFDPEVRAELPGEGIALLSAGTRAGAPA